MRLRLAALVYGLLVLIWLQLEDNAVLPVVLFGLAGSLLLTARWAARRGIQPHPLPGALLGAAAGAGAALAAAALMILKTGLHGHLFPDYPPAQILAVLARAPVWALAGALAGLGVALALRAVGREND